MSKLFAGYKLPDYTLDELVDADVETVVFYDPNRGRYVSSLEDWQDYGVADDGYTHLRQSRMVRL
jgi:hypothetical protein